MSDLFSDRQDFIEDESIELEAVEFVEPPVSRTVSPVAAWRRLEQLRDERQLRERLREFYDD